MIKKTEIAKQLFNDGDIKGALKIASSFRLGLTKAEKATLKRGYEAFTNPGFYQQLGKDTELMKRDAVAVFEAHWL